VIAVEAIGDENWFSDYFFGERDSPLLPNLRAFKAKSVLDIGCGDATTLLLMHYMLGVTTVEGVEGRSAEAVFQKIKDENALNPEWTAFETLDDVWGNITTNDSCYNQRIAEASSRAKFMENVKFGTQIEEFEPKEGHYDAVICCHVMHYLDKRNIERVSNLINQRTHPSSLIYFSAKDGWKDGDKEPLLPGIDVLALCRTLKDELKDLGVVEYKGPKDSDQAQSYIFTNLGSITLP